MSDRALRALCRFCRVCPCAPEYTHHCETWDCPLGKILLPKGKQP